MIFATFKSALFIGLVRNLLYLHHWWCFVHSQVSLGWCTPCEGRALLYLVYLMISQVSCNFLSATRQFSLRNFIFLTLARSLIFPSLVILRYFLELSSFLIVKFNLTSLLVFELTYQFIHVITLMILLKASHGILLFLRCLQSQWQLIKVIIHTWIISYLHEHLILGIFLLLYTLNHPVYLLSRQLWNNAHVAIFGRLQSIFLALIFGGSSTSYFGFLV